MDRELDKKTILHRRRRRLVIAICICLSLAAIYLFGSSLLRPSLSRKSITTATVSQGRIEGIIEANGLVAPGNEHVLSSPIDARVLELIHKPGDHVSPEDVLLKLDLNQSVLELETLRRRIDLLENQMKQTQLEQEKEISRLQYEQQIKHIDFETKEAEVRRTQELYDEHYISRVKLEEVQAQLRKAKVEIEQINDAGNSTRKIATARLKGLELELIILNKEYEEAQRRLELATANSPSSGVITWIIEQEGTTIRQGDIIARIADLESFKVEATLSDIHASRVHSCQPVRIRYNHTELTGQIETVHPTITNGIITLDIRLDDPSHPILRSNLRVDVQILTDIRMESLLISRGSGLKGHSTLNVFVIKGEQAVRTKVTFGISNYDTIEVIQGLNQGDEVIVSDMDEYNHLSSIGIKE